MNSADMSADSFIKCVQFMSSLQLCQVMGGWERLGDFFYIKCVQFMFSLRLCEVMDILVVWHYGEVGRGWEC